MRLCFLICYLHVDPDDSGDTEETLDQELSDLQYALNRGAYEYNEECARAHTPPILDHHGNMIMDYTPRVLIALYTSDGEPSSISGHASSLSLSLSLSLSNIFFSLMIKRLLPTKE